MTVEVPAPLKTCLDMIYSKSRTKTAKKKEELRKIPMAHALMHFCRNEEYLSSLLIYHNFWWMYSLGWVLNFLLGGT